MYRRFEKRKARLVAGFEFGFDAEDEGDVLARDVSAAQAESDGDVEAVERGEDCVFEQVVGRAR